MQKGKTKDISRSCFWNTIYICIASNFHTNLEAECYFTHDKNSFCYCQQYRQKVSFLCKLGDSYNIPIKLYSFMLKNTTVLS